MWIDQPPYKMDEESQKIFDLFKICKNVNVFECEGVLFMGEYVSICKEYVKQNPSKPFFIWLQDNHTILNKSN